MKNNELLQNYLQSREVCKQIGFTFLVSSHHKYLDNSTDDHNHDKAAHTKEMGVNPGQTDVPQPKKAGRSKNKGGTIFSSFWILRKQNNLNTPFCFWATCNTVLPRFPGPLCSVSSGTADCWSIWKVRFMQKRSILHT